MQYRVSGPDLSEMRDIAMRLAAVVAENSGVRQVNYDWIEPARMVRIRVDQDQARLLGLSTQALRQCSEHRGFWRTRHPGQGWHLFGRTSLRERTTNSAFRCRRCARCRSRSRMDVPFHSARLRPSISSRNIH